MAAPVLFRSGNQLRVARQAHGLTLVELSELAYVHVNSIVAWQKAKRLPNNESTRATCAVLLQRKTPGVEVDFDGATLHITAI